MKLQNLSTRPYKDERACFRMYFVWKITSKDVTWPQADTARISNITRIGNITGIENVTEFDSNLD